MSVNPQLEGAFLSETRRASKGSLALEGLISLLFIVGFFLGPLKLLGSSWLSYLLADGLALVILTVVFSRRLVNRKPLISASPLVLPLLILSTLCLLELVNPEAPFIRSVLGLRSWLLYLSFYFVGWYTFSSAQQIQRYYALLIGLGVVTGAYGVMQWQAGPESFANWSEYYGAYARLAWVAHSGAVFRAFSTFVAPGTFGGNMGLLMLLALAVIISPRIPARWRLLSASAFAVMGAGVVASGSRGPVAHLLLASAMAFVLVGGVRAKFSFATKTAATVVVAATLGVVLIGSAVSQRYLTIFDPRAFFWKWFLPLTGGVRVAAQHPFGLGLGYTAGVPTFISSPALRALPGGNIDSGYGAAAAELGFVGLALFVYFALAVGIRGLKAWRSLPPGRLKDLLLGPALFAGTFPIVTVIAQPQASLPSSIYWWLLVGALFKAAALNEEGHADPVLRSKVLSRQ